MCNGVDASSTRELLWTPSEQRIRGSAMADFLAYVNRGREGSLVGYDELWAWSVEDLDGFWGSIWSYFDVLASATPRTVLDQRSMPGAVWFPGARLNWTENLLRHARGDAPAIVGVSEDHAPVTLTWAELTRQVASLAGELRRLGVHPGDRVAAYLPNIPQAVVALLATAAVGAIWSCCSPDFGTEGVLDRFRQIEPTVLIGVDGYRFGGKDIHRLDTVVQLSAELPTVKHTVVVEQLRPGRDLPTGAVRFDALVASTVDPVYEQVPFDHPLWILYSSGTTGVPKGIVHSHGGILLEHLKSHGLHFDTGADDRVFV
ncbi:MAG: acetoacetyl-CoA synthetase, partial [Pseudonocardiales bacterium]|nr:acetoacetyl-CoA synthetase [Pseudonocardiales bacterium]